MNVFGFVGLAFWDVCVILQAPKKFASIMKPTHAIYHTGLDAFVHNSGDPADYDPGDAMYAGRVDKEIRFLFCAFSTDDKGPLINIYNDDLSHLLFCHVVAHLPKGEDGADITTSGHSLSTDHNKLYKYLVELGIDDIRFVPWSEDKTLNWKRSFPLIQWGL